MSDHLGNAVFANEGAARVWLERHLWPNGPVCPHCGVVDGATFIEGEKHAHRDGLYMCNACRKQFTVTVGTIFERSHVPLNKWLQATFLMCASKKGMSAHQMHRMLSVTYKTAWFMCHRIREAMAEGKLLSPLGGQNKVVEVDETYVGGKAKNRKNYVPPKSPVLSLVERDGKVRSRHIANVNGANLRDAMVTQIDKASYLMTDEAPAYVGIGKKFSGHGTVNHSAEEYVRAYFWHTNTVEGYFSILKRGIMGTYHHVSEQHLHRYLAEFDFRYNERSALRVEDRERTAKALQGIVGKRLTYRRTRGAQPPAQA